MSGEEHAGSAGSRAEGDWRAIRDMLDAAGRGGLTVRRALQLLDETLDFILSDIKRHQKVLSRRLAQCDLYFNFLF